MKNPMMDGRIAYSMGRILYNESNFDDAMDQLEEAAGIFQDLNNRLMLVKILILQANIMIEQDNQKRAGKILD